MATATAAAEATISTKSEAQDVRNSDTTPTAVDSQPPLAATETVSDIQKKMRRAERFGVTVHLSEADKRNTRAQRFGTAPATQGSDATKNLEDQKRKARAERFGLGHGQSESNDTETKKKARLARFGEPPKANQAEEDKKKARALRFSQPPCAPNSQVNGKGNDAEPKMAITVKADGAT